MGSGGPTLDGRFAEIERLRGRVAVVVFWSSENEDFNRQTNRLVSTLSRHASKGVYLLGVNMDANKAAAEEYVRQHRHNDYHSDLRLRFH